MLLHFDCVQVEHLLVILTQSIVELHGVPRGLSVLGEGVERQAEAASVDHIELLRRLRGLIADELLRCSLSLGGLLRGCFS